MITSSIFSRMQLLVGTTAMERLGDTHVAVFGVGGVGSWCAEALIRSGIGKLTIVDSDVICSTNINRQVQATGATIGNVKVKALLCRLREINSAADIVAKQEVYRPGVASTFVLNQFEYIIDAIDSLSAKVDLIIHATKAGATVFTSLGASCRIDPTRIRVDSLWNSRGCRLGKLVRKRLRRRHYTGNPLCVYSEEMLPSNFEYTEDMEECFRSDYSENPGDERISVDSYCLNKKHTNGSAVHVTGTFGFFLAGLVIQDVMNKANA